MIIQPSRFTAILGLAVGLAVGWQFRAAAQSDNFDDGDDNGWIRDNTIQPYGGINTYSFPNGQFGKGYRVQCTSSAPLLGACGDCGTARAFIYRTNDYTDFYAAVDILSWDNNLDQALVLLARATGLTNQLSPCPLGGTCPPGFGTASGYVCNYDCNQDGATAGDFRGGQFQINIVTGESPSTIAAANVTLVPGKAYRLVFTGVGTVLTGQIYDLEDLSGPIVTIQANDGTYTEGVSGLVSFSRDGTTTDVTFDNYYAAATDPNTDIAPAIRHSVPNTPQVVTRTPGSRFTNFHPSATAITFSANTFSTNVINASATRMYLNNADVSPSLSTPPNGTSGTFTLPSVLADNTVYAARIELTDLSGTKKSTNTFWFDTFSDSYLTNAPVKAVEAEEYNYSSGTFQPDPIAVSGYDTNTVQVNGAGVGYLDQTGTPEVDYHDQRTSPEGGWTDFRVTDFVGTIQGNKDDIQDMNHVGNDPLARPNDHIRQRYAAVGVNEYEVSRTEAGEWLNYTRVFANTNYYVFLRCGSLGNQDVNLDLVGGDVTTTNQTLTSLGRFSVGNHLLHQNYKYEPLMKGGVPVVVHLSGTNTVRLTMGGIAVKDRRQLFLNYVLFVPTDVGITYFDPFQDGDDTNPAPAWNRYNPIGVGSFSFPGGNTYRIQSGPSPDPGTFGQGRAGSIKPGSFADFYVSVDVVSWNDTIKQVFGVLARVQNPGPGTTTGYMFSYDRGNVASSTAGDMDIIRLDGELPTVLPNLTGTDSIHFDPTKQYRIVFMGSGGNFTGQVYQLPDTSNPLVNITATDANYPSGSSGLVVANNNSPTYDGGADATFDNFLSTTAEPRLQFSSSGGNINLTWPSIPFTLQSSPSLTTPVWTSISTGISQAGNQNTYSAPMSGALYYRLIYP